MISIEERLVHVCYRTDQEPHIRVEFSLCAVCPHKACVSCCPAGLYRCTPLGLEYTHLGCLECGTCLLVCDRNAVQWDYPKGSFGMSLRFG